MNTRSIQATVPNFRDTLLEGMQSVARLLICLLPWSWLLGAAPADVVLTIITALFVISSLLTKDGAWLKSAWVKVAIGIWIYLTITNFLMNGIALGVKHSLPWGRFVLFAAAVESWVFLDSAWRRRFWFSLGGAMIFTAFCGLYEYIFGYDLMGQPRLQEGRLFGPFRRPKMGIFLVKVSFPVLLFSMVFLAQYKKYLGKAIALCLWGAFVGIIFLSGERMALLLTGLGGVLAFLLLPHFRKFFFIANAAVGVLLVALLLCVPSQKERIVGTSVREFSRPLESPYQVLMMSALKISRDFPVFGTGVRQFREVCPNPRYGPDNGRYERCSTHPHNFYVEWLVEAGVVGLCAFLFLIGVWSMAVVRAFPGFTKDPLSVGLVISIVLQLWPIGASGSFFNNWNSSIFWLMLGLMLLNLKINKPSSICK